MSDKAKDNISKQADYDALLEKYSLNGDDSSASMLPWFIGSTLVVAALAVLWVFAFANQTTEKKAMLEVTDDEVKQLQEYLEERTAEELRTEVKELQKIKVLMAEIRRKSMAELKGFEENIHKELPKDVTVNLAEMSAVISDALAALNKAELYGPEILKRHLVVAPLVQKNQFVEAKPLVEEILKYTSKYKRNFTKFRSLAEKLSFLSKRGADMFAWSSDEAILYDWKAFDNKINEHVNTFQWLYPIQNNINALDEHGNRFMTEVDFLAVEIQKILDNEAAKVKAYEKQKADWLAKSEAHKKKAKECENSYKNIKKEMDDTRNKERSLNRSIRKMPKKTAEQKEKIKEAKEEEKALKQKYNELRKEHDQFRKSQNNENKIARTFYNKWRHLRKPRRTNEDSKYLRRKTGAYHRYIGSTIARKWARNPETGKGYEKRDPAEISKHFTPYFTEKRGRLKELSKLVEKATSQFSKAVEKPDEKYNPIFISKEDINRMIKEKGGE